MKESEDSRKGRGGGHNRLAPGEKKRMGKRVRALREAATLTRDKFAELCDMDTRTIANIEFGDSSMSLATLKKMCIVLSCNADDILFGEEMRDAGVWSDTVHRIENLPVSCKPAIDRIVQGLLMLIRNDDA